MYKDSELRGMVLQKYYEHRGTLELIELKESDFNGILSSRELWRINKQLKDHGYITWGEPLNIEKPGAGLITTSGINVVEGSIQSSIPLEIKIDSIQHNNNITVSQVSSDNIQIGNSNTNIHDIDIQKLINAINNSGASTYEIEEAKSIINKLLDLPLMKKIIGKIFLKGN